MSKLADTSKLDPCCAKLVQEYRATGDERDRAALYCLGCKGGVVLHGGVWRKEREPKLPPDPSLKPSRDALRVLERATLTPQRQTESKAIRVAAKNAGAKKLYGIVPGGLLDLFEKGDG